MRAGKVVNKHGHLVVEHQRQVRLGGLDLGFGLGLDIGIDGESDVVGFVDGRRLRARLAETVPLLQRSHFEFVDGLDDLVEFAFQSFIVADVEIAGEQRVECLVKVLLGGFQMVGLVVGLSGGVLLFGLRDQRLGRIGRCRLVRGIFLDFRLLLALLGYRQTDHGCNGRDRGVSGDWFGLSGLASGAEHKACNEGHRNHAAEDSHYFEIALSDSVVAGDYDVTTREN